MIFTYRKWDVFCDSLKQKGLISIPAKEVNKKLSHYIVLKHDVETNVPHAFTLAEIENKYGHRGVYYVQAYLMNDPKNIALLKRMQEMGHEISYHYDVMDSNKGNIDKALVEFEKNREIFEINCFHIETVCQHGNPIVERIGYHSNRDFFRSEKIQKQYPEIADIMVDYKKKYETDYLYYSDAGRKFKLIFDPLNNDLVNSDDKNATYEDLKALLSVLNENGKYIVSTHPHRWTKSAFLYVVKNGIFKMAKFIAKVLCKIPFMKKFMSKYYYLAKKI